MAELFGDRSDFAIEAGVEPHLEPPSALWGHMCVWCRGAPLGKITELHCGLGHTYTKFRWLPSHLDELWAPELSGLDDISAWNFLDGLLYGYHGDVEIPDNRTIEQCRADWDQWGHHNLLTNWGEQFDGYKAFILCPPGDTVRILSRRLPEGMGRSVEVSRKAFVVASEEFVRWFEAQQLRLAK